MDSALWNLALYRLPNSMQVMTGAKPDDPIPYRFCPHINGDTRLATHFCLLHIAYMCSQCWACHSYECKHEMYRARFPEREPPRLPHVKVTE